MHVTINALVLHQIPRPQGRAPETPVIEYSDEPAVLDPQAARFLREELIEKPLVDSRKIRQSGAASTAQLQTMVREVFDDPAELVAQSKMIAAHLYEVQQGNASSGLVMVADGTADGRSCLIISKVEHQQGMHLESQVAADGTRTFDVELLSQLIIGRNARVYKIAILWKPSASGEPISGLLVDKQNGKGYAAYFLDTFLGFELTEQAEVLTKSFAESVQRAISALSHDPARQGRYEVALLAELGNNNVTIHPSNFIRDNVEADDVALFQSELHADLTSQREFTKDLRLLAGGTERARVQTESGAVLLLPTQMITDGKATFSKIDGTAATRILIEDEIEKWSGSGAGR